MYFILHLKIECAVIFLETVFLPCFEWKFLNAVSLQQLIKHCITTMCRGNVTWFFLPSRISTNSILPLIESTPVLCSELTSKLKFWLQLNLWEMEDLRINWIILKQCNFELLMSNISHQSDTWRWLVVLVILWPHVISVSSWHLSANV